MGKVATNANAFLVPVPSRPSRACVRVAEGQAIMHIVANRLDACPSWRHATEKRPSGIRKTVGLAVAAAEQKFQRLVGQILYRDLSCIGFDRVRQTAVIDYIIT